MICLRLWLGCGGGGGILGGLPGKRIMAAQVQELDGTLGTVARRDVTD